MDGKNPDFPRRLMGVCHCILNPSSKVAASPSADLAREEALRKRFLRLALEKEIDLLQLPCPELTLYGGRRWGHVREQFDNPFFRAHCRKLLQPYVEQLREYAAQPQRYELLGIVGLDGSPSCGVTKTCCGPWGGELDVPDLAERIASVRAGSGSGIFVEELEVLLRGQGLVIPILPLGEALLEGLSDRIGR